MESLKSKKFDSFKESKISNLTSVTGGYRVATGRTNGKKSDDVADITNTGAGTNNDTKITKTGLH